MSKDKDKEPVPMWRVRLLTLTSHKDTHALIRADVKAALDHIDHLHHVIKTLGGN